MKYYKFRLVGAGVDWDNIMDFICSCNKSRLVVSVYYFIIIITCLVIAGCGSTSRPAPIIDRVLIDSQKTASRSKDNADSSSVGDRVAAGKETQFYTVQGGDTLYSIAIDHGLDLKELAEANNISDPSSIKPGQQISLERPSVHAQPILSSLPRLVLSSDKSTKVSSNVTPESSSTPNLLKNNPKGLKLPYSDQALAELQSMDNGSGSAYSVVPIVVDTNVSPASEIARIETAPVPQPQASNVDLDGSKIEWAWPTAGKVQEGFSRKSRGVIISGEAGQSVLASAAGQVVYSGDGLRGYGNLLIIKHNNSFLSAYAHNSKMLVQEGDAVTKGQKIAEMGNTDTDTAKLHFEIRKNGKPVDPLKFLPDTSG